MTIPKPPNIDFAEAAAMMHAGVCAWIGLVETAQVSAGQNVLVHAGAGAIGGMAIQIARETGCHVTTTCSASNADYVRSLGAHRVIEYDGEFRRIGKRSGRCYRSDRRRHHERSCRVLRRGGTLVWLIGAFEDVNDEYGVACRRNP